MSNYNHSQRLQDRFLTRRELLARLGNGFAALGLAGVLGGDAAADAAGIKLSPTNPLLPRKPHFPAKAKHVIFLFMNGGPSHIDTFDPKPELTKYNGKPIPVDLPTERKTGAALGSPFAFQKYGKSGLEVSDLFPHVGSHADELAVIRSMYADVPNHEPSLLLMNCGEARMIRPSLGSWVTYGLGTDNQNLPGFVALCPGGYPIQETQNWQSGFIPGVFAGTHVDPSVQNVEAAIEHIRNRYVPSKSQRETLDLVQSLNKRHLEARQNDALLEARIQSMELAYRMQTEATDAFDVSREPAHIREMYGDGEFARGCLMARRLVERGVRFVQLYQGDGQPWDSHDDIHVAHKNLANASDKAIGALLTDLKQRGLLEETLVIWGGEFGRTPTVELPGTNNAGKQNGRDHNHYGFTMWLAGGGAKGGTVHGATDEFGFKAVTDPVHVHDLHATILHLLGFDHTKMTYRHAGRDFRLTDVYGSVVRNVIA
ncbi:MAG: DUF1501 domain-containing protein [Akkermansiaceae bacterium]|nr:DUF1501 domain-containing protein [Armatimonadota bacterium]